MVDAALLRPGRFDEVLLVPPPDLESRIEILRVFTKRMPIAPDVSLQELAAATPNCTGAELEVLCKEAALIALNQDLQATCIVRCRPPSKHEALKGEEGGADSPRDACIVQMQRHFQQALLKVNRSSSGWSAAPKASGATAQHW